MTRTAIIGDVGGHREPFAAMLAELGLDLDAGTIPEDLTVVQVGDLVHRGPDSHGVLDLVERFLGQPGWVQLAGNHEAQYLRPGGPTFEWPRRDQLDEQDADRLRRWWSDGLLQVAHATPAGPDGVESLVTHAGLGVVLARAIGATDSGAAASALNGLSRDVASPLWWSGEMLSGGRPEPDAGPLWAHPCNEVAAFWRELGDQMPFHQVTGHNSPVWWRERSWAGIPVMREHSLVDFETRHVAMVVSDEPRRYVITVDPAHGRWPSNHWAPWIIEHDL